MPDDAVIIAIIIGVVAPTWLAWWNSRFTKKEMKHNGGKSFRDDFDKLARTVRNQNQILDIHTKQLQALSIKQKEIGSQVSSVKDSLNGSD